MHLITIPSGPLDVNSYIAWSGEGKTCFVVDPGDGAQILERLENEGLACTHILITHGHFDHIFGLKELKEGTGAQVLVHALDAEKLASNRANLSYLVGRSVASTEADTLLGDGDRIQCGGMILHVLYTPGHSQGAVCYVSKEEKVIFCGDTVFYEDAGRTDFPGCSERTLYNSITQKLFSLDGDYTLYPGHGQSTALEHERNFNPLIQRGARLHW